MNQYKDYKIGDFLLDDDFVRWVRAGSPNDFSIWQEMLVVYPEKKADVEEARLFILEMQKSTSLSDNEVAQEINRILADTAPAQQVPIRSISSRFRWWQVAAAVLVLVGVGWGVWQTQWKSPNFAYDRLVKVSPLPLTEVFNTQQESRIITLPDGSKVTLASNSKISYALDINKRLKREVFLTGEAFFDVTKNSQRPFLVYADGLVTRVIGTSFTIKTGDKQVSVVVRTGRVAVYSMKEAESEHMPDKKEMLTPNQEAKFMTDNQQIIRGLVKEPVMLATRERETFNFQFDNMPIAEVFAQLEKAYGLAIIYDKVLMKNCLLTVNMGDEPFFTKLDIICQTIGADYKVNGTQIIVSGSGCD
ncbi:MAG: FecR domain-containing protein [Bacteroidetes bacterium]|nr:FecR domain-containing protein [Bacteroidota bacterium]